MGSELSTRSKRFRFSICSPKRELGTRRSKIEKIGKSGRLCENGQRDALAQGLNEKSYVTRANQSDVETLAIEEIRL
jgi:hypothetical protein